MFGWAFRGKVVGERRFAMSTTRRPTLKHLPPHEGVKSLPVGKIGLTFKAGRTVGSSYSVAEMTVPAGMVNPMHAHPTEETIYVLDGEFEMYGEDGQPRPAGPGCSVHVPSHAAHGFANVGATLGRLLFVMPPEQESYFDEVSKAMAPLPERIGTVLEVRARYGAEDLGPLGGAQ
jgi:quercetin dioxygenase-like cupin family protein